jgi:ketosteroid isomerase-like protein
MINMQRCFALVLIILPCPTLFAAIADGPEPHESDRQALRLILADVETGINQQDWELILRHLDEDVVITYQNAYVARGKDAVRAYNTHMITAADSPVLALTTKAAIGGPAVFHGDTAIGHGTTQDHMVLRTGQTIDLDAAWSTALVKKNGLWKIAALHFSTNVLDNGVLRSTKRVMLISAIITTVLALLIGFALGRRKNKVKKSL